MYIVIVLSNKGLRKERVKQSAFYAMPKLLYTAIVIFWHLHFTARLAQSVEHRNRNQIRVSILTVSVLGERLSSLWLVLKARRQFWVSCLPKLAHSDEAVSRLRNKEAGIPVIILYWLIIERLLVDRPPWCKRISVDKRR